MNAYLQRWWPAYSKFLARYVSPSTESAPATAPVMAQILSVEVVTPLSASSGTNFVQGIVLLWNYMLLSPEGTSTTGIHCYLIDHKSFIRISYRVQIINPAKPGVHVLNGDGEASVHNKRQPEYSPWCHSLAIPLAQRSLSEETYLPARVTETMMQYIGSTLT